MFIFPSGRQAAAASGFTIDRSLRFRRSNSAFLSRTPGSAGSRTTWTYSAWVKRGAMGSISPLFYAGADSANNFRIQFVATDTLAVTNEVSGVATTFRATTQVFRDPSAWYHIVVALDTTQATAGNRVKVYVNSREITSFGSSANPTQNATLPIGNNVEHRIGLNSGTEYFDGFQTEINYINGQALTPTSFGEFDSVTGVWKPKDYTGSYGTTGFHLNFADNSANTAAAIGKDISGNGNNWTPSGISLTAGETYDSMTDVPTLTSATAANYCTLNPVWLLSGSAPTITNGNLQVTSTSTGDSTIGGTIGMTGSGKYYAEFTAGTASIYGDVGVINITHPASTAIGNTATSYNYRSNGNKTNNSTQTAYGATYTTNDVIGVALDLDAGTLTFYKNNTSQGTAFTGISASNTYAFACGDELSSGSFIWTANFGQRPFTYTPPTGFKALNTFNLPDSTIKAGNKHMDVVLRTASGTSGSTVSSLGFKPDLIWDKSRSITGNHSLTDSVRGISKYLQSSSNSAEATDVNFITSLTSNGFTIGSTDWTAGTSVVDWCWKAGGSAVTNTAGSITSQVSANTAAGFSIVTYTGTGTSGTVGHGLGVAPKMVIIKQRSGNASADWRVSHASLATGTSFLVLNTTSAAATTANNFTAFPTSTVINIGGGQKEVNGDSNSTYVAYCFAEVPGFSQFGSYTGNGNSNGPFVFLGFTPAFILIKPSNSTNTNWLMLDTKRPGYNVVNSTIFAQSTDTENTTTNVLDILSNGFKIRGTSSSANNNGTTMIYAAFAENPFKNSLAR